MKGISKAQSATWRNQSFEPVQMGKLLFPVDAPADGDSSVEIRRILGLLRRADPPLRLCASSSPRLHWSPEVDPDRKLDLPLGAPQAVIDAMEAEGLIALLPIGGDESATYCLTAEGCRRLRDDLNDTLAPPARTWSQLADAQRLIARQRSIVIRLRQLGRDTNLAEAMLAEYTRAVGLIEKTAGLLTSFAN